jgi:CheY-like chemotaxis protein
MHILILEDRGDSVKYLIRYLEKKHKVYTAVTINQAKDFWRKRETNPIDCIIIDLNMPSRGLSKIQKKKTIGGLLSGWRWVCQDVFSQEPDFRQHIIIYSDYIEEFEHYVPPSERKGVYIVSKSKSLDIPRILSRYLQKIDEHINKS